MLLRRSETLSLLWIFTLAFLLSLPTPTSSQSCANSTVTICDGLIPLGTPIFEPKGLPMATLERYATSLINYLNLAAIVEPCYSYAVQAICGTWLRPCVTVGGAPIPVPQEPCLSMCWTYYNACVNQYPFNEPAMHISIGDGLYFPIGAAPLDCSASYIDIGANNITYYASTTYEVEYQGQNITASCSQGTPVIPPFETGCTTPLVETLKPPTNAPGCAFVCPLPSLSDSQYDNVKNLQGVVGWLSWALTAWLVVLLVVYPKTRDFPRNLVIMTALAANIAAGAIILPTYAGYDETWCGGSGVTLLPTGAVEGTDQFGLPIVAWTINDSFLAVESSLCTFQGAMLQYGFLAAVFWWVLIAFNMCFELYLGKLFSLEKPQWRWGRLIVYTFIGWGLPFILMVIPAAAGRIKFVPAGTYCFVTNEDNYAWSLTFWFLPVGISLILGVTLFIMAIIRVTILFITIKKITKLLMFYPRLLLFLFLFLVMFIFIVAYNIQVANNSSAINQGYADFYTCLLLGATTCSLPDDVTNYNLVMLKAWAISSLGTLLFFIFLSWDVLVFWFKLVKMPIMAFINKNPKEALEIWKMVAFVKSSTSIANNSTSLAITEIGGGGDDDEAPLEEEEEGDEDESSSESSRSDESH